jgi:hypothetical protein
VEEKGANQLYNDYSHLSLSLGDIRDIIAVHPNLGEARLRKLLDRYSDVVGDSPNLIKKYGTLAIFQEFIVLAAYDSAHGGNYAIRKPSVERQLNKGMEEAVVALGAMEMGKVPWPLMPSTNPHYEAVDPNGQTWDVKSPLSVTPNGTLFNIDEVVKGMQKDFGKGEKVILDDRNITLKEIQKLYRRLKANGEDGRVIWWPTDPTP